MRLIFCLTLALAFSFIQAQYDYDFNSTDNTNGSYYPTTTPRRPLTTTTIPNTTSNITAFETETSTTFLGSIVEGISNFIIFWYELIFEPQINLIVGIFNWFAGLFGF